MKDASKEYTGGRLITLRRSVQRLSLIMAVEELDHSVVVENGQVLRSN